MPTRQSFSFISSRFFQSLSITYGLLLLALETFREEHLREGIKIYYSNTSVSLMDLSCLQRLMDTLNIFSMKRKRSICLSFTCQPYRDGASSLKEGRDLALFSSLVHFSFKRHGRWLLQNIFQEDHRSVSEIPKWLRKASLPSFSNF